MLPDDLEIYWLVELTFPQDKGVLRKDRFIVVTHTFVRWWESQSLRVNIFGMENDAVRNFTCALLSYSTENEICKSVWYISL